MQATAKPTAQTARILVVEDEAVVALDLERDLQEMGYAVCAVTASGEEAIASARRLQPDLVLMDIVIRGEVDGIDAARQIMRETDVPVVFLTAHGDAGTIVRAAQTAPYGYLTKPFNSESLRAAIEVALHRIEHEKLQRERAAAGSELLAQTDPLTGVANRRRLVELGQSEINRSRRGGAPLALLMIDVDRFKQVNDGFGHEAGDRVLRTLADVCRTQLREIDVFGRLGGDEFVAVLPNTDLAAAREAAGRLREQVSRARVPLADGRVLQCTISVGVARWRNEETLEELMSRADRSMYDAKRAGRDRVSG